MKNTHNGTHTKNEQETNKNSHHEGMIKKSGEGKTSHDSNHANHAGKGLDRDQNLNRSNTKNSSFDEETEQSSKYGRTK